MTPETIDEYSIDDVGLFVHRFDTRPPSYWISVGFGSLELDEKRLLLLTELLESYRKEELTSDGFFGKLLKYIMSWRK